MTMTDKTILVTGANRGLGQALVDEALSRGAQRVYATSRQPFAHPDPRVTPLIMDVTDWAQIQRAVESVESLDILINNAGVSLPDDLSDRAAFEQHFDVNVYGPLMVTQALLPSLTQSRGRIVNVVSIGAFAAVPVLPAYSASKAAAFSVTQSLRALLAGRGVKRSCRPARSDRHRHGPGPPDPEDPAGVGRASHLRRGGERGGGDLPRPVLGDAGRELAHGRGQGARAPERHARTGGAHRCLNARQSARPRPFSRSRAGAVRNFPRLLDVHRSGDSGSPRVARSISRSRSSNHRRVRLEHRPTATTRPTYLPALDPPAGLNLGQPAPDSLLREPRHTRKQRHTTRPMRLGLARRPQPPAALVTLRAEQTPALRDLRLRHTIKRGRQSVGFWHATSFSTRAKAPFHNASKPHTC